MTFATNEKENFVFGLPGNPMSAFVTFHLFVLPTLRQFCGYSNHKLSLPAVSVEVCTHACARGAEGRGSTTDFGKVIKKKCREKAEIAIKTKKN